MRRSLSRCRLEVAVAAARLDQLEREVEDDAGEVRGAAHRLAPGLLIGLGLAAGFLFVVVPSKLRSAALWGLVQLGVSRFFEHVGRT